jgi:hypothetical protein
MKKGNQKLIPKDIRSAENEKKLIKNRQKMSDRVSAQRWKSSTATLPSDAGGSFQTNSNNFRFFGKKEEMKCSLYFFWILLIMISCKENELPRTDENLFQSLSSGLWEISFFEKGGINLAAEFDGISFVFYPNGKSEAYQGSRLLDQGTWSTSSVSGKNKLLLSFSRFEELNGDWNQGFVRSDQIQVQKENGNSESQLFLEKIQ